VYKILDIKNCRKVCANYTHITHSSGPQSTTYTCYVHPSTETHFRQQFLTSNILNSSLFYHLAGILTKLYDFIHGVILTHYKYICILTLTTLRRPHEWPKHAGGYYIIKLHLYNQRAFVGLFNKVLQFKDLLI
jgi:hypothetical protein